MKKNHLTKIQHLFMVKTFSIFGMERSSINLIKPSTKTLTSYNQEQGLGICSHHTINVSFFL